MYINAKRAVQWYLDLLKVFHTSLKGFSFVVTLLKLSQCHWASF